MSSLHAAKHKSAIWQSPDVGASDHRARQLVDVLVLASLQSSLVLLVKVHACEQVGDQTVTKSLEQLWVLVLVSQEFQQQLIDLLAISRRTTRLA